jgi:ribonuclease P protein component
VLPAVHRLTDADVFRQAARKGRRAASRTLVVHLLSAAGPPDESAPVRVGFVVNKAVGNAVVRNRVKRRLRPLVREQICLLPAAAVLVVRALPPAGGAPSAELRSDLDRCLKGVRG